MLPMRRLADVAFVSDSAHDDNFAPSSRPTSMRYNCALSCHDVRAGRSSRSPREDPQSYDRADHGHHGHRFTLGTHRHPAAGIGGRSPCAIFSSAARPAFPDPALHLRQTAGFSPAAHGAIRIAAFRLLLNFRGEFFRRRLPSSSAFWQFHFRNGQLHGAFDVAQRTTLAVLNEQQRATGATRTTATRYGERRTRNPSGYRSSTGLIRSTSEYVPQRR